ncbi:MAG: hypothetical protein Q8K97_17665 [Pseudohongiella sp.]|nr:hypothetical protein [Pseudohongiella sp.]
MFGKNVKPLMFAAALPVFFTSSTASAFTVFDAANYQQNLWHYIEMLRNVAVEHGLMDEQLQTMIQSVLVADEQLRQLILAARQLDNLTGYIEERDLRAIYDSTQLIFGRLRQISPRDPNYSGTVAQVMNERYPMPEVLPPYEVLRGSDAVLSGMNASYQDLQRGRAELGNSITSMSAAGELTQHRLQQIEQYRQELNSLGDLENPALATSQLATKQQNLIMLQNEEMIARMDREEQRKMQEEAELLQFQHQLEAERMERLSRKSRPFRFGQE